MVNFKSKAKKKNMRQCWAHLYIFVNCVFFFDCNELELQRVHTFKKITNKKRINIYIRVFVLQKLIPTQVLMKKRKTEWPIQQPQSNSAN